MEKYKNRLELRKSSLVSDIILVSILSKEHNRRDSKIIKNKKSNNLKCYNKKKKKSSH